MGTSADMAVRHQGRTYYQHTSYDGQTANILSNIAGTLAACGIKALRERMDREGEPMTLETECYDEVDLDRHTMGNAYLLACQARGKAPVGLDHAMHFEYGNPDFTHGGLVALFAPEIDWCVGFCNRIEDASVILDLDKETIVMPSWSADMEDGSYEAGTMPTRYEISFADIDGMDPQILFYALSTAPDLDEDEPDKATIPNLLANVRDGKVVIPPPPVVDADWHRSRESFNARPSVHTLTGLVGENGHAPHMHAVVDFLRAQANEFPEFAPDNALVAHPDLEDPNAVVLYIDLRATKSGRASTAVQAILTPLAQTTGMVYQMKGDGYGTQVSSGSMASHASTASPSSAWDKDIIPEGAKPVGLPGALDASIASGDTLALNQALVRAMVNLDEEAWQKIEASGVTADPKSLPAIASFVSFMSGHFEAGLPGSTQQRFSCLSEGRRSALLEGMQPIDRYLFVQLIKQPEEVKSKRAPGI